MFPQAQSCGRMFSRSLLMLMVQEGQGTWDLIPSSVLDNIHMCSSAKAPAPQHPDAFSSRAGTLWDRARYGRKEPSSGMRPQCLIFLPVENYGKWCNRKVCGLSYSSKKRNLILNLLFSLPFLVILTFCFLVC